MQSAVLKSNLVCVAFIRFPNIARIMTFTKTAILEHYYENVIKLLKDLKSESDLHWQ